MRAYQDKNRIKICPKRAGGSLQPYSLSHPPIQDFFDMDDLVSVNFDQDGALYLETEFDILADILFTLSFSPLAQALVEDALDEQYQLGFADLGKTGFCLDVSEKTITLNSNGLLPAALGRSAYFKYDMLLNLVRALRDIWQENRNGGSEEQFSPEDILLIERVRAADLDVIAVQVAWELRHENFSDIWRHLIGSNEGDLAMAYSSYLERNPSSAFNNDALFSAFQLWFESNDRVNAADHETLEYMDEVIEIMKENPFNRKRLNEHHLEALTCLPDRSAYLHKRARDVIRDPRYAGLRDEINQSHLFHIMLDLETTLIGNVAFRDSHLAGKIFPDTLTGETTFH